MKVQTVQSNETCFRRIKGVHTCLVKVPEPYRKFLWEYPSGEAPLEKIILRILTYRKFEDVRWVFSQYPEQTYDIMTRYPNIHKGVKFWIKRWCETKLR